MHRSIPRNSYVDTYIYAYAEVGHICMYTLPHTYMYNTYTIYIASILVVHSYTSIELHTYAPIRVKANTHTYIHTGALVCKHIYIHIYAKMCISFINIKCTYLQRCANKNSYIAICISMYTNTTLEVGLQV